MNTKQLQAEFAELVQKAAVDGSLTMEALAQVNKIAEEHERLRRDLEQAHAANQQLHEERDELRDKLAVANKELGAWIARAAIQAASA